MLTEKDYCDKETSEELEKLGYPKYHYDATENDKVFRLITLYAAQKWLREEKKLFVEITLGAFDQTYLWEICNTENSDLITGGFSSYDTYEDALSEGIKEAIKILKEK